MDAKCSNTNMTEWFLLTGLRDSVTHPSGRKITLLTAKPKSHEEEQGGADGHFLHTLDQSVHCGQKSERFICIIMETVQQFENLLLRNRLWS